MVGKRPIRSNSRFSIGESNRKTTAAVWIERLASRRLASRQGAVYAKATPLETGFKEDPGP